MTRTVKAAHTRVPVGKARCGACSQHSPVSEASEVGNFLDPHREEEKEAERLSNLPTGLKSRSL